VTRVAPGLAFSIVCDLGFALGLVTLQIPRFGDLVWLAEPVFDEEPDLTTVEGVDRWRWPVFFPTGPALRRQLVIPVGVVDVPVELRAVPRMRGGNRQMGWREVRFVDGVEQVVGVATDRSLPVVQIVNDTALKEMLVAGWRPEQNW
jgi:hypothetical protein